MKKLVSVAMCTYNGAEFLDEQIKSIIDQSYRPLELVVCDDCSTDDTRQKLERWKSNYPDCIRLFFNEKNLGYNKNFEQAVSECAGDYIAIADQDDIWLPNKIERLREVLAASDAMLAYSRSVNFKGHIYHPASKRKHLEKVGLEGLVFYSPAQGHTIFFKRALLDSILPFPEKISYDWWIAAITASRYKLIGIDDVLVYHRLHDNSAYYSLKLSRLDELKLSLLFVDTMLEKGKIGGFAEQYFLKLRSRLNHKLDNNRGRMDVELLSFLIANLNSSFAWVKYKSGFRDKLSKLTIAYKIASA